MILVIKNKIITKKLIVKQVYFFAKTKKIYFVAIKTKCDIKGSSKNKHNGESVGAK